MRDETSSSYKRALHSFKGLFGQSVPTVDVTVTDQEAALMNAVAEHFPSSHHQLCRWHLTGNVKSNPLFSSHFSQLMMCRNESVVYQLCFEMGENFSNRENAYLNRMYDLKEKFVEAWVCRYRNLGTRATQRAESVNSSFKTLLPTNCSLVDLFHTLLSMTTAHMEANAFTEFQMRDRPRIYHPMISSLVGQVPYHILDLVELELNAPRWRN